MNICIRLLTGIDLRKVEHPFHHSLLRLVIHANILWEWPDKHRTTVLMSSDLSVKGTAHQSSGELNLMAFTVCIERVSLKDPKHPPSHTSILVVIVSKICHLPETHPQWRFASPSSGSVQWKHFHTVPHQPAVVQICRWSYLRLFKSPSSPLGLNLALTIPPAITTHCCQHNSEFKSASYKYLQKS